MAVGVPDTGLPVGTVLSYNAHLDQSFLSWIKTGIGTPDELFQAIGDKLNANWGLQVVGSDYSSISSWTFGATPITLKIQMVGPQTYAQPDDVRSLVDHEIINALASNPIVDSNISGFTLPAGSAGGSSTTVDTGAPAANTGVVHGIFSAIGIDSGNLGQSISDGIANATKNLGAGTGIIVIVLGLGVIAAIFVAAAPTAGPRAIRAYQGRR